MPSKAIRLSGRAKTILFVTLFIILFYSIRSLFFQTEQFPTVSAESLRLEFETDGPPYYLQVSRSHRSTNVHPTRGIRLDIDAASYREAAPDAKLEIGRDDAMGRDVLYWNNAAGWVEWSVHIPEDGLYEVAVEYRPLPGTVASIVRGLMIDGSFPFLESESIEFERYWQDGKFPYNKNELGNEIRSPQEQIDGWRSKSVSNYEASSLPLQYYFTKGSHSIRMTGVRESVAISKLSVVSPDPVPGYNEYVAEFSAAAKENDWFQVVEAEQYKQKSNIGIQKTSVQEPYISPDPKGHLIYNTLGGDRWQAPGQWVDWDFEVPKDGWYALDVKYRQSFKGRTNVYRTILLDGRVPYEELLHYAFHAKRSFDIHTLQQSDGSPLLFYLEKGKHTLRMVADSSPVQPAFLALTQTLANLRSFEGLLRPIVGDYGRFGGENVDWNRTWDIKKYVPDIEQRLDGFIGELEEAMAYLNGLNGSEIDLTASIKAAVSTLRDLKDDVDKIPNRLGDITSIQDQIGMWFASVGVQPLQIDYFVVRTPETATSLKVPNTAQKLSYSVVNFTRSFYLQYNEKQSRDDQEITVWVSRGRDYVDLLKELIAEDFTPMTGIKVNVSLMPNANALMLSNAAGKTPDIALGVGMEAPVDYAMRNAVADLTQFPDFGDIEKRFLPGMMLSYTYDRGIYGLPEEQPFSLMFYRTDIFDNLNITPPDTWDDLYRILPTLQENGMTFYYPVQDGVPIFYQHGFDYYTSDGLQNRLRDEEATAPFIQWTELIKKYSLPIEVPSFYNHFRIGDIPIGIGNFGTYVTFALAAPDIAGHWEIAPIPGIRREDGTVVRWNEQGSSSMMIMQKSKKKDQAWQFLKWWSSKETQLRYAQDIESFLGFEYRWNSANLDAMVQAPWDAGDLQVIKEQVRWIKNVPIVPGSYFLGRELSFAWNNAVLAGMPDKAALEQAAVSLQREMRRKQEEFGIEPSYDLDIPQINQPYDWGGEGNHE